MKKNKKSDKLQKIQAALKVLAEHELSCRLCPRQCGVDRKNGQIGFCGIGAQARVSHALLHFGEEPILSGSIHQGSGTIFFSGCGLKCCFCQNYQISQLYQGRDLEETEVAETFLDLQQKGALNINLVTPSHVLLPILKALYIAIQNGLNIPLVYNCSGYERSEVIKQLDGIIDIYLPDLKYFTSALAKKLSGAPDYFKNAGPALVEMYCQQPIFNIDKAGLLKKGMLVRHLVLPGKRTESIRLLSWLAGNLSPAIGLSLMSQYHPCFQVDSEFNLTLSLAEYQQVLKQAEKLGFENIYAQPEPFSRGENLLPDFNNKKPFKWSNS